MKKLILIALAVIAFFALVGTVGAYDRGNIGLLQTILQSAVCIAIEWIVLSRYDRD